MKPTDLVEFGLIPEFTGRLALVARFNELTREMLVRIMTEPRNCIYRQFQAILKNEGVDLAVATRAFEEIADLALEYKSGARSLRGLFEEVITPVLYAVPDHPESQAGRDRLALHRAALLPRRARAAGLKEPRWPRSPPAAASSSDLRWRVSCSRSSIAPRRLRSPEN